MIRTFLFGLLMTVSAIPAAADYRYNFVGNSAQSTDGLGNFAGTLDYTATGTTTALLTLTLTNTSTPSNGGYITAFVLDNPDSLITGVTLTTTAAAPSANFALVGGVPYTGGVNAAPFGSYGFGASTGGSFEGGGKPQGGIAVGQTGAFTFALVGTNLDQIPALLASPAMVTDIFTVVRFRGFNNGGSDKVPVDFGDLHPVPEPTSMALLGLGMGTLALVRARRRRAR